MSISSFNWLDWVIVTIVVLSSLMSLRRGFFREALSLVIWFMALLVSLAFYTNMALLLQPYIASPVIRQLAAIFGLFVLCLIMGGLFSFLMGQLIKFTGMSAFDKLAGGIFGFFRGVVIVVVVVMAVRNSLPVAQESWWLESQLLPHVIRMESSIVLLGIYLKELVMPLLNNFM